MTFATETRARRDCAVSDPRWAVVGRTDADIRGAIHNVVESVAMEWEQPERRIDKRYAYPNLLMITPISDRGFYPVAEPIHVVGKWLAERGLDFFHTTNFPYRRAIVTFENRDQSTAHLILNISWSRFLQPGWYDSGGRFTHVVRKIKPAWDE